MANQHVGLFTHALGALESKDESRVDAATGVELNRFPIPSAALVPANLSNLKVARSVFSPGKTYRFRTVRSATLTASGAGTMALVSLVLPSTMSSYSGLAALFAECRLRSTRITYVFRAPTAGAGSMVSSFEPTATSGWTTTYATASQTIGAKIFNIWGTTGRYTNVWNPGVLRAWSQTANSGTGSDPLGSSIGGWQHVLLTATTASAAVADYMIECDYEFRNPY